MNARTPAAPAADGHCPRCLGEGWAIEPEWGLAECPDCGPRGGFRAVGDVARPIVQRAVEARAARLAKQGNGDA